MRRTLICLVTVLLFIACNEKKSAGDSLIEKSKIQTAFNKNPNKVLLDHFYVVLDSVSFEKLRKDPFMKQSYASVDAGMPDFHKVHDSSSVFYLRGKSHYIEILGPDNPFNEPVGQIGIGFSMAGDKHFPISGAPQLKEKKTKFLQGSSVAKYTLNNKEIDWYKAFYTYGMETNLATWYAHYNPSFLQHLGIKADETYSREDFLKNTYAPNKLFEDITAITLACNPADHFRIARELELLGCPLVNKPGADPIFEAGDIYLRLVRRKDKERSSLLQVETSLNHKSNKILELGAITIKNKEKKSLWIFNNY